MSFSSWFSYTYIYIYYTFNCRTCSRSHEVWEVVMLELWLVYINIFKCIYFIQMFILRTNVLYTHLKAQNMFCLTRSLKGFKSIYVHVYVGVTNWMTHVLPHTKPERQCHSVRDSYINMYIYRFEWHTLDWRTCSGSHAVREVTSLCGDSWIYTCIYIDYTHLLENMF